MMVEKVFAVCAILGTVLFVVRLALFFVGGDSEADGDFDVGDADFDGDVGEFDADVGDSDVSFRMLSLQTVTAFFMIFGLAGLALLKEAKWQVPGSLVGAVVAGCFAVFVVGKIMVFWKRLQSSGTIDMANAIGQQGSVYLTIPAGGTGKVQVTVQERFKVLDAIGVDEEELKTGERITVVGLNDDNTLIVQKL
jgi:hypothetical protein